MKKKKNPDRYFIFYIPVENNCSLSLVHVVTEVCSYEHTLHRLCEESFAFFVHFLFLGVSGYLVSVFCICPMGKTSKTRLKLLKHKIEDVKPLFCLFLFNFSIIASMMSFYKSVYETDKIPWFVL